MNKFKPDVVDEVNPDELKLRQDDQNLPDVNFENVTILELEQYYKKNLARGAVYFVGFDVSQVVNDQSKDVSQASQEVRYNLFLTGPVADQLRTIAIQLI